MAVDDFVYAVTCFPLHFLPYDASNPSLGLEPESNKGQLSEHSRFVRRYLKENAGNVDVDDILPNGEQLGEAIVGLYAQPRERKARQLRFKALKLGSEQMEGIPINENEAIQKKQKIEKAQE